MKCPRDHTPLKLHKKGRLEIHHCSKCCGFQVCLNQFPVKNLSNQLHKEIAGSVLSKVGGALESPYAESSMKRFIYRDVSLDYCEETNSVWFDQGEYTKIFKNPQSLKKSKLDTSEIHNALDGSDFFPSTWDITDITSITGDIFDSLGDFFGGFDF